MLIREVASTCFCVSPEVARRTHHSGTAPAGVYCANSQSILRKGRCSVVVWCRLRKQSPLHWPSTLLLSISMALRGGVERGGGGGDPLQRKQVVHKHASAFLVA
jgi:hypothetical protein